MPLSSSGSILILEKSDAPIFKSKIQEESQCITTRKTICIRFFSFEKTEGIVVTEGSLLRDKPQPLRSVPEVYGRFKNHR